MGENTVHRKGGQRIASTTEPSDFYTEVLKGNIEGHSMVSISGHDTQLTTTRTTIAPSTTTVNINQSTIKTTPAVVKVASTSGNDTSAGSGIQTILLIGLDTDGAVQTELITMNGQTEVTTLLIWSAINGWRGMTWGATTWNEGDVWIGTGVFSSGVPAVHMFVGEIRENRGNTAYYTIPTGYSMILRQLTINVATTNKDCDFYIETSTNGINWITEQNFAMEPLSFQGEIIAVPQVPAGSAVRIEGISSGAGTDVVAILGAILIKD